MPKQAPRELISRRRDPVFGDLRTDRLKEKRSQTKRMSTTSEPINKGRRDPDLLPSPSPFRERDRGEIPAEEKAGFIIGIAKSSHHTGKAKNRDRHHLKDPNAGDNILLNLGGSSERRNRSAVSPVREVVSLDRNCPREGKVGDE